MILVKTWNIFVKLLTRYFLLYGWQKSETMMCMSVREALKRKKVTFP